MRPSWDEYFLSLLPAIGARATCDRGRSGCLIVFDRRIISTGYVGAAPGQPHCDDVGHNLKTLVEPDGTAREHCVRTIHAEQNAIVQAARFGVSLEGATLYCTMEPCRVCAMLIISAGIKRVVAGKQYHAAQETRSMFYEAGVVLDVQYNEEMQYPEEKLSPGLQAVVDSASSAVGSIVKNATQFLGEMGWERIPALLDLTKVYYEKFGNPTGGNLHIVLDDGNTSDEHITMCLEEATKANDYLGFAIASLLLELTEEQRDRFYFLHCNPDADRDTVLYVPPNSRLEIIEQETRCTISGCCGGSEHGTEVLSLEEVVAKGEVGKYFAEGRHGIPRRNCLDLLQPAELAIHESVQAVEKIGAHLLLTEAVILLAQAKDKVSDYIDGHTQGI